MSPLAIGANEQILSAPVVYMSILTGERATPTPSLPASSPRPSRSIWGRGWGDGTYDGTTMLSFGNSEWKSAALRVIRPPLVMLTLFLHRAIRPSIRLSCGVCGMLRRILAWPLRPCESGQESKPVRALSFLSPLFSCRVSYIIPFIMSRGRFVMSRGVRLPAGRGFGKIRA